MTYEELEKENEELKAQIEWLEKCKLELGDLLGEIVIKDEWELAD